MTAVWIVGGISWGLILAGTVVAAMFRASARLDAALANLDTDDLDEPVPYYPPEFVDAFCGCTGCVTAVEHARVILAADAETEAHFALWDKEIAG